MPVLDNPKWEAFCQHFVLHGSMVQAYINAGYKTKNNKSAAVNATRLLKNANVNTRIKELRKPIQKHVQEEALVTVGWIVEKAKAIVARNEAAKRPNDHAIAKALNLLSGHSGGFDKNIQKHDHTIGGLVDHFHRRGKELDEVPLDELRAAVKQHDNGREIRSLPEIRDKRSDSEAQSS